MPQPQLDESAPQLLRIAVDGSAHDLDLRRVATWPELVLEFSEAIDPASVHEGSLSLRQLEGEDPCSMAQPCESGRCWAARCVSSGLSDTELSDLLDGEYVAPRRDEPGIDAEWTAELSADGRTLTLRPARALAGEARYELVVGGLRDASGNPLRDWWEDEMPPRVKFSTRHAASGGVQPRLAGPRPGQRDVPTNLAKVRAEFDAPATVGAAQLEGESGDRVMLTEPRPCDDRPPQTCYEWSAEGPLEAETRYRFGPGTGYVLPQDASWFETAAAPDLDPPQLELSAWTRAHCLHVGVSTSEAVALELHVGAQSFKAAISGWLERGVNVGQSDAPVPWSLVAVDAAGQEVALDGEAHGPDAAAPALAINEVLANPLGPEPRAEFVELVVLGDSLSSTEGLYIADASWEAVLEALALGEPLGDPLPSAELSEGQVLLLAADGYELPTAESGDAPVADGTVILRIGSSIGDGGLKNAGEPLVLYRAEPPTLLSSYGNWIATEASEFGGVSVERQSPSGCDGPADWRANHAVGATPGRLP